MRKCYVKIRHLKKITKRITKQIPTVFRILSVYVTPHHMKMADENLIYLLTIFHVGEAGTQLVHIRCRAHIVTS